MTAGLKTGRYISAATLLLAAVATLGAQADLPPPFPRVNATRLVDTDRIAVWNIVWPKGQPTALHRHVFDQVGTYYAVGGREITQPNGEKRQTITQVGSLSTTKRGTTHIEEGTTDPPLRAVFIELKKDGPSGLAAADIGPAAFPRPGAKQALDDERVTVWDYEWPSGAGTLRYGAARDTVIVWLGTGRARVARAAGAPETIDVQPGTMRYLPRGGAETIEMIAGAPRVMFFELK